MIFTYIALSSAFVFGATLDEAFRSALQKNEVPGQAREQVVQAQERVEQARSGPLPNIAFKAEHLIQPELGDPLARAFFPQNQSTSYFTLTQPLFRGFREFAFLRQQKNLLAAQKQKQIALLADLYEKVATTYLQILAAEQDLKNLNEQLGIYARRVKELQGRSRRGESQRTEVLTAQATEAALKADAQLGEANLRTFRQHLHYLTDLPVDTPLQEPQVDPNLPDLAEYLAGLEKRPDVLSAKENAEAAKEEVAFTKGAHWPTADVTGNYYLQRPGIQGDLDWDVRFALTFPLFEGGLRVNQTQEASSKQRQSELELARLRREADGVIRALHENLKLRVTQLEALSLSAELAQKNYQTMQTEFRRGLIRNIDVQIALTDYGNSRRKYDQARYSARLDKIKLEMAAARFPQAIEGSLQ